MSEHSISSTDTDRLWPGMPAAGWLGKFDLPMSSPAVRDSFNNLAFDQYAPKAQRYRRFSQFVAWFDCKGELTLNRLVHRPFVQAAKFNSHSGGILREFERIEPRCDIKPYIQQLFDLLQIDRRHRYHLDVHQYRVYATPDAAGTSVPEGPHRDGMDCVAILVIERQGITGQSAAFSLIHPDTKEPFFKTVVDAGKGILLNDKKMLHDADPIAASGSDTGYRDYFVVNINDLDQRRYGRAHEKGARSPDAATYADPWAELKKGRLIVSANDEFDRAQALVAQRSKDALGVVRGVEAKVRSLKGHDEVFFSADDLLGLKKQALVVGINHFVREARLRRIEGLCAYGAMHQVDKKMAELQKLKGGVRPNARDGLVKSSEAFFDILRRDPPIWALRDRAERDPKLREWVNRKYPHSEFCL